MITLNNNNISGIKLGDSDVKLYVGNTELYTPILIIDGYEAVDLGLPSGTKWAKCNVGASSETDYGNFYRYGGGSTTINDSSNYYQGSDDPLPLNLDTARQVMGGNWHMPTQTLCQELIDYCLKYSNITIDGVLGHKLVSSINGKYIFFPYTGYGTGPSDVGVSGNFWTSTPKSDSSSDAFRATFRYDSDSFLVLTNMRFLGFSVRGVIG